MVSTAMAAQTWLSPRPPNDFGTISPSRPSFARSSKFFRGKTKPRSDSSALARIAVADSSISRACSVCCSSVSSHCGSYSKPTPQKASPFQLLPPLISPPSPLVETPPADYVAVIRGGEGRTVVEAVEADAEAGAERERVVADMVPVAVALHPFEVAEIAAVRQHRVERAQCIRLAIV